MSRTLLDVLGMGFRLGVSFGFLDLFLGSDLSAGLWGSDERMPELRYGVMAMATSTSLSVLLAAGVFLVQRIVPRARALDPVGLTAACLSTCFLLTVVLFRSRTLFTLWFEWRSVFVALSLVYGLCAIAVFDFLSKRSLPVLCRASPALLFGVAAYAPIWISLAGLDAFRGIRAFPLASPLIAAIPLFAVSVASIPASATARAMLRLGGVILGVMLVAAPVCSVRTPSRSSSVTPASEAPSEPAGGDPVILIVLDTLRADHLGVYGYDRDTSPHLDEFARHATVFDRCISPSSWTVPAHASIFTGLYPRSHGAHLDPARTSSQLTLSSEVVTLAEMLRSAGYRTGAAVANTWLRSGSGFEQGFDSYFDAPRHEVGLPPWFWMLASVLDGVGGIQAVVDFAAASAARAFTPYPTFAELTTDAQQWIAEAPHEPFFLFINGMETHDPFEPPPPFRDRFAGRLRSRVPFHHLRGEVMRGREEIDPRILDHLVSQYDGEIAHADRQVHDFLEALRRLGIFDRSWIVVTSDHGEHFGEHGLLWHRTSVYESLLRVPLIIKEPGQRVGQRAAAPVQLTDLMPTLLRTNGIEPPERLREHGLWKQRDGVFSELYYDRWIVDEHGGRFARNLYAYEQRGVKLIASSEGDPELYDIARDPLETNDLADEAGARVGELQREMDSLLGTLPDPPAESVGEVPDDAALQRLRNLGYID